jgi:hypothetical protein
MKILDIIVPHQTLDENAFTDLMARSRQKVKDVANDVGELTGIRALRTPESKKIADYVDNALISAGKDLKRSDGLAAAEKELLALEKNISLEGLSRKRFDEMAEYLATRLAKEDRTLHDLESPIVALQNFIKNEPNPQAWMNSRQIRDNLFNDEYQTWLTKNANARVKVKQEVELAKPAPPKEEPKTKAEREEEKIADKDRKNRRKEVDLKEIELDKKIKANKQAENAFAGLFLRNMSDEIFLLGEAGKIGLQYQRSRKFINEWEASGVLPDDVAKFFPPVPPDLKEGSHVTGGDKGVDERIYVNEKQRVAQAADWARTKLTKQLTYQILGGTGAFIVGHYALKAGGGTFGSARKLAMASKILERMSEKASSITTPLIKVLAGVSMTGKYLFADYFLSAVNGGQVNSKDAASVIAKLGLTYQDLTISHTADINKAVASLFLADTYRSLESAQNSEFAQQVLGAWEAAKIPFKVVADPFETLGAWIWKYFKLPDIDVVPPAEGEIPGVGEPVKPLTTTTDTGQNPPKPPEQVTPQVTDTSPPAPPEDNNKIKREKLEETLKYKVLSRMRS